MKTFLVPFSGNENEEQTIKLALNVAKSFNALVDILHISSDPQVVLANAYAGVGMAIPSMDKFIEDIVQKNQQTKDDAYNKVNELCNEFNIPLNPNTVTPNQAAVTFSHYIGKAEQYIPTKGRLHDLIITGRSIQEAGLAYENTLISTLFGSGRPVIIVPPDRDEENYHVEVVAIAWNGSSESTKALVAVMPLLSGVKKVCILTEENSKDPEAPNATELTQYLEYHGINADTYTVKADNLSAGAAISEKALEVNADLLVMGAFSHNRLRQMIMGGVTTFMLEQAPLPVLMVH